MSLKKGIIYNKDELERHLKVNHGKTVFSLYLKQIVYGGIDGIVTTFAVTAGFTGASFVSGDMSISMPISIVLIFGIANLFADGVSMGIGEFISSRAEKNNYEKEYKNEITEIKKNKEYEIKETIFLLKEKGFNDDDAKSIVNLYKKNPNYWANFMVNYEIGIFNDNESPLKKSLATISSFIFFGFIPLISYIFSFKTNIFISSIIFSMIALIVLGYLRARVTKEGNIKSIIEILFLGSVAGGIAFFVGYFINS